MADSNPDPASPHEEIDRFLWHCQRRLESVATGDEARQGAAVLAAALDRAEPRPFEPAWLPVLDSAARLADTESGDPLTQRFLAVSPLLPWTPTQRATDGGTELALASFDRAFDLGETVVGLMYVGPQATYPLHHHPPQELYLTIAGEGRWRYGGNQDFEAVAPRRTLYNHPGDLHSSVAGALPVVALYLLW